MAAQLNTSAPPPMTPQQRLTILLQPKSPSEILISQSPHQGEINWVFQDQATGVLRYANMSYMDSTGQMASASPSVPLPVTTSALVMTQQSPNRVAQQAHQMSSAGRPTTPMSPQPAMAINPTNMVSPQQMPEVDQQVDWTSKIAEVMREQFGLSPK